MKINSEAGEERSFEIRVESFGSVWERKKVWWKFCLVLFADREWLWEIYRLRLRLETGERYGGRGKVQPKQIQLIRWKTKGGRSLANFLEKLKIKESFSALEVPASCVTQIDSSEAGLEWDLKWTFRGSSRLCGESFYFEMFNEHSQGFSLSFN